MEGFPWALLSFAFLDGLVGSTHCMGMCGPFIHILNSHSRSIIVNQLIYNVARGFSYALMGGLLGYIGSKLNLVLIGSTAATIGGILVMVMGIGYLFPNIGRRMGYLALPNFMIGGLGKILQKESGNDKTIAFLLGLVSAFLPCGLLYHAYAFALVASNPLHSAIIMFVFAVGTMPGLAGFSAVSGWLWKHTNRSHLQKIMGWLMLFAGLFIIFYRSSIDPSDPEMCEFPNLPSSR